MVKKITKNQFSVLSSLIESETLPADIIRPGVLGGLCAKLYVNVNMGVVSPTDQVMHVEEMKGYYRIHLSR